MAVLGADPWSPLSSRRGRITVRSLRSTAGDVTASVPPDYSDRVERDERFHSSPRGSVGGERGLSGRPEAGSGSLYARGAMSFGAPG